MSEAIDLNALEPAPGRPALKRTPATGRHAILPGIGLAKPNVIVPMEQGPSACAEQPDLDVPGRLPEDSPALIRRTPLAVHDTEQLLNGLIGECGFLMREVAFRCIIQSAGVEDRLAFMRSAMSFAETGAKVADSVARLRAIPLDDDRKLANLIEANKLLDADKAKS